MGRGFDIFEILPDNSLRWRLRIHGIQYVDQALDAIGRQTKNECYTIDVKTKEIIARVNDKASKSTSA